MARVDVGVCAGRLICALAGWVLIGRIGSVSLTAGQFANIESITVVVIDGVSLFGGRGSISGMFSLGRVCSAPTRSGLIF